MRLLPTISRLFADYSATALRLFRAQPESCAGICAQFRRGQAARPGGRPGGRSAGVAAGGAGMEGSRQRRGSASAGANVGGGIKAARGMSLFAPELPFKRAFVL